MIIKKTYELPQSCVHKEGLVQLKYRSETNRASVNVKYNIKKLIGALDVAIHDKLIHQESTKIYRVSDDI